MNELEITGGHSNQSRYKLAFARLKVTVEKGCFIEASMIAESVISDRLLSHLNVMRDGGFTFSGPSKKVVEKLGHKTIFRDLIEAWKQTFSDPSKDGRFPALPDRVDLWREKRNVAAHAIVKANPETRSFDVGLREFMGQLGDCAREGASLAREVSSWKTCMHRLLERKNKSIKDSTRRS